MTTFLIIIGFVGGLGAVLITEKLYRFWQQARTAAGWGLPWWFEAIGYFGFYASLIFGSMVPIMVALCILH